MSNDPIRRGIRRGVSTRETGSAPDLGRVERVHRVFRRESRRSGRSDPQRARRRRLRRLFVRWWSVVIAVLAAVVLLGIFGIWLVTVYERENPAPSRQQETSELKPMPNQLKPPDKTAALELVTRVLAIRQPEEVPPLVRCGDSTPEEVVAFLAGLRSRAAAPPALNWLSSLDHNHMQMEGVVVVYRDEPPREDYLALLCPDEDGSWKMDFAAFSRRADPPLQTVLAGAPQEGAEAPWGVARVILGRDQQPYYNGIFLNEDKWVAYGVASPDLPEQTLAGYCLRDSPQHRALERILTSADNTPISRVTLKLRRPPGAEPKQVEIGGVLAEDWVLGRLPFDETDPAGNAAAP